MNARIVSRPALGRLVALVAALVVMAALPRPAAAMEIAEVVSPGGIRAWLVEDHALPVITMRFAFRGGVSQDPQGKEGLVNLMSGLFDEGAGDLDSDAFQTRLDAIGAEIGFDAGRDSLTGSIRLLSEERVAAFDLLSLALTAPRFDSGPVERIRGQLLAGIEAASRKPATRAADTWRSVLYRDHPYARRDTGTAQSLAAVSVDDLRQAKTRLLGRDNLVVAVVGDIDRATLATELDRVFGGLPARAELAPVPDSATTLGEEVAVVAPELPQTQLQLAYPGIKRADPGFYAAYLMNQIFGGGTFTSRLYEEVREKRGLAYSVDSSLVDMDHAQLLLVSTGTRADRAAETLAIIRQEAARLVADGVTEAELAAAKANIIGGYAIANLSSSTAIARTLVDLQLSDLGIDYIERRQGLIEAVTAGDVHEAARRLLSATPSILALGPEGAFAKAP